MHLGKVAYGRKVFDLREGFESVRDKRREPKVTPAFVAAAVFFCGLLRTRSFNALEPKLRDKPFRRLIDAPPDGEVIGSADTLSRALRRMDMATVRRLSFGIVQKAGRNKVFREGWHGALHTVAIDGWEAICSYNRHCDRCLVRHVRVEQRDGTVVEQAQYYHRYAVAMLTVVKQLRMSAVIIARKNGDEPLKEALTIWDKQPPHEVFDDKKRGERLELWDCRDITTLSTYDGPIRVVRAVVKDHAQPSKPSHTWCMVTTGVAATRLSPRQVLAIARGRWHIENTGFHQWVTRWYFEHVFVHDAVGIQAIFWLFFAGFNLLTLFLYRQLCSYGRDRGRDVTRTISRLIDEINDDLARLDCSPWDSS
ncbi:MAG TPA: hypothetical protein VJ801_04920 [Polyangia bacterium]|nr:hypothetical protein [Polyangia bacterium]